jgi:formylglycine-generating enzyme required for sulfatase activity
VRRRRAPARAGVGLALALATLCASAAAQAPAPPAWRHPVLGLEFVRIEPGCFEMGAERAGGFDRWGTPLAPRADELPRHRVCLDGYWLGRHEVTRAQWHQVMGGTGQPPEPGTARWPTTHVGWEDAQAFLQRLNALAAPGERYRLPTEAEWEHACQPGEPRLPIDEARRERIDELARSAWTREPRRENPTPRGVGELEANPLGLHDMLGNVWEWTADHYLRDGYARHAARNPLVRADGGAHVLRGGSYKSDVTQARCGARAFGIPDDRLPTVGLRLVREAAPAR